MDLILYAELLTKHKKIDLKGIYIAGSGHIDVKTGSIIAVNSLFHKLNGGICYGIKIFIFSSQQKKDIENYCNAYINNGGSHVIKSLCFYYVDNVDQLEAILYDISKTKKKLYDRKSVREIRKIQHEANVMWTGLTNMDSPITKEFIENKKIYGDLRDALYLELHRREGLLKISTNIYEIIQKIQQAASYVKINSMTCIGKEQNELIEKLLQEIIFPLDPFYKKYYQSCVAEIVVSDKDILDL